MDNSGVSFIIINHPPEETNVKHKFQLSDGCPNSQDE